MMIRIWQNNLNWHAGRNEKSQKIKDKKMETL